MNANWTGKRLLWVTCMCGLALTFAPMDAAGQAPPADARLRALAEAALRAEGRTLMSGDLASALQGMPEADDIRGAMEPPAARARARNAANAQSGIKVVRTTERIVSGAPKISGSTATLDAQVVLERYMTTPEPGGPDKWVESGTYRFDFEQANGGNWRLVRYEEVDPFGLSRSEQAPGAPRLEPVKDSSASTDREGTRGRPKERPTRPPAGTASNPSSTVALASIRLAQTYTYNWEAARSYARIWACPAGSSCFPGNPSYRNFENSGTRGGDCTNFVSQVMRAGGWPDVGGYLNYSSTNAWWYDSFKQSYTWVGAHYFYQFAATHYDRAGRAANVWDLIAGDVLQVDFEKDGEIDHTMFVSWHYFNPKRIYLSYHTTNTLDRPLSDILALWPNANYYAWFIY